MKGYAFLIVGGGIAAGHAAETFAESDNYREGDLGIISADSYLPYDRTQLSKDFLAEDDDIDDIRMHDATYYAQHGIDVYLDTRVRSIDPIEKVAYTEHGDAFAYGSLLLATGSTVNTLDVQGSDLEGLLYLRSLEQSQTILEQVQDADKVVMIGGGYIGMEVASVLADADKDVTMIFPEDYLMQHRFFTPEMGAFFESEFEEWGVTFVKNARVDEIRGEDGHVAEVRTESNGNFPADLVIAGTGVTPNTELAEGLSLVVDKDTGGFQVDSYLETSVEGVYAAGDTASYPDVMFNKRRLTPHWDNARQQGVYWAQHMLNQTDKPFKSIPYFFSDVFDLSYEFWGDASEADNIIHRGDIENGEFSVWWLQDNRLQAAFVMSRPDEERELAQDWIASQQEVDVESLENNDVIFMAV